jgi:hypothetical protein
MDNLTQLAVSKFKLQKSVRNAIGAGDYEVDENIRVLGTIRVGEDYDQDIVGKIPWITLLGVALSKLNGVSMKSLVREAFDAKGIDEEKIKSEAQAAINAIKSLGQTTCKGKVTSDLTFELLSEVVLSK